LINTLRDHIQSSQPPIRKFSEHPKDIEKILRKSLTLVSQPKTLSYEQIRNDLKSEYKQKFYLIDPIVDITRDTFDHCDISQMNEKINLDILDSNISQTAYLYNNQTNLLTTEESNALKSNQLSWLQQYLITNESKEKKLTRKQNKELNKILHRTLEILSSNPTATWEELTLQLQREFPKAHDLCHRSVELIKQSQKDGLFLLQQAPIQDKRRASSLITERARQNLKSNRNKIILSLKNFLTNHNKSSYDDKQLENYLNKTFNYLETQKQGQFKSYQDLKEQLKKDFHKNNHDQLIEQMVDVIEQAHATNQFDDMEKPEVQTLMKDRLEGKRMFGFDLNCNLSFFLQH
jgi:translation initiation factor 2 alpha subunit (eIF-2alpha)